MLAKPLEDFFGWHVRTGISEGLLDTLSHPVRNRDFLTIECAYCRTENLAGRSIGSRFHAGFDVRLQFSERDGYGSTSPGHASY